MEHLNKHVVLYNDGRVTTIQADDILKAFTP
jgi:hypothetical protein